MAKWKVRKVIESFRAPKTNVPKLKLECGHIVTDPMLYYENETAYAIHVLAANMANNRRVRCYQCHHENKES